MADASTGGLSSYAYILMLLHYLQRTDPPVIPVLQEVHNIFLSCGVSMVWVCSNNLCDCG